MDDHDRMHDIFVDNGRRGAESETETQKAKVQTETDSGNTVANPALQPIHR